MTQAPRVVAHMIVGPRSEPYLADALASIEDVCDHAVINDNSGEGGATESAIRASGFARRGRLTHLRTRFVDFASARNACIDATPPELHAEWALFVDADEVHGDELRSMAALLPHLPADVDALDGYSRNFVGSFSYWTTIHRRLRFFRLAPNRRWEGNVHERLVPLGRREVVPAVGEHYGHVCTVETEVERERLYKSLGQTVTLLDKAPLGRLTPALVWAEPLRDALPFHGQHPLAAAATIARLSKQWAAQFAAVDAVVAQQAFTDRLRNRIRNTNYAQALFFRSIDARLRWGYPAAA